MSSTVSTLTSAAGAAQLIDLPELAATSPAGAPLLGAQSALLDSIEVSLQVVVGQTRTTLGQLMALKEADLLKVDRKVDYPVDVIVNGNVVARGQLVVVDDAFGVRVTEVALDRKA